MLVRNVYADAQAMAALDQSLISISYKTHVDFRVPVTGEGVQPSGNHVPPVSWPGATTDVSPLKQLFHVARSRHEAVEAVEGISIANLVRDGRLLDHAHLCALVQSAFYLCRRDMDGQEEHRFQNSLTS